MNNLEKVVRAVLKQQKQKLAPTTYDARKNYLQHLLTHAEAMGISEPCQELFDSYVSRAVTTDLHFQLFHAVRLVDKEAGTKAFTPEGKLYNEPKIHSASEAEKIFQNKIFPIVDNSIDTGHLIRRAESEMKYLHLSTSTSWQYMQAWRELYIFLYLRGCTTFNRASFIAFIEDSAQKHHGGTLQEWKWKIQRRSTFILIEIAETGYFKWKLFVSKKICCAEETLEELRQQYITFWQTQNLENKTISLYDYVFREMVKGLKIGTVSDFSTLKPEHIQSMLLFFAGKLSLNSRRTVFPIIRQLLSNLYATGFTTIDFSGMVLTPAYQSMHLRPYISATDEEKLYQMMKETPYRTRAMMRLALRLGLRDIDICGLRFSQIDWKNDQIILKQEKTGTTLVLPLLEDVGNSIMDYIMNERPDAAKDYPFIFVRKQAPFKKLESMYRMCSQLIDQADIKTVNRASRGVHVCRYTLTHKLLLKKISHQVITDTLGHVSKESDKPYLSMEEQMLRECPLDLTLIGQKYWEEGECHA